MNATVAVQCGHGPRLGEEWMRKSQPSDVVASADAEARLRFVPE